MLNEACLLAEEKAIFQFRSLYSAYGYSRFRMSRFERYDLYARNKDFLASDRMITFTDSGGTLMALKPDVTISIIKNAAAAKGLQKLYYNEKVYRPSKHDGSFKELTQTGLECIGSVDGYCIAEAVTLAAKSLALISPDYILDISHMGIISAAAQASGLSDSDIQKALSCIGRKDISGLRAIPGNTGLLVKLASTYGSPDKVLEELRAMELPKTAEAALDTLSDVYEALKVLDLHKNVQLDFSVVNNMNYYSGIVFQGFIKGLPDSVLSGGQYDRLMAKMGRDCGAIGFAVYLDQLEALNAGEDPYDTDVLLVYTPETPPSQVLEAAQRLTELGQRVLPVAEVPEGIRYRRVLEIQQWGK